MLSKIFSFSHRKTEKKSVDAEWQENVHASQRPFPALEQNAIRVLVFKDCDRKGKSLLFDSKSFIKNEEIAQNNTRPRHADKITGSSRPQYPRPSHDANMLGEMMFGSVAMKYKGSTVKVHMMRSPPRLLLTKVFTLKPRTSVPNVCSENSEYFHNSGSQLDGMQDSTSLSSQNNSPKEEGLSGGSLPSKPVAVPGSSPHIEPDEDSGFMQSWENVSAAESVMSLFTPSTSPCGSYHRRLRRSQVTSIDHSFGRRNKGCETAEEVSPVMTRRPKIGVGIIFTLGENEQKGRALQGFFFSHFPLLEFHVHRLRLTVEKAFVGKSGSFPDQVMKAVEIFRGSLNNLLSAPRLKEPVWLNMMTQSNQRKKLCDTFKTQLIDCLHVCNNRETNFFLATVLTAVLTYHLAWVPTVMPARATPSRAYLDKHSSQMLDLLAQSHPYNPLWAQLGDLYGAIGQPLRVARTVVVGQNAKLVEQVLHILSYFIRCTEVSEHFPERAEEPEESADDEMSNEERKDTLCSCKVKDKVERKTDSPSLKVTETEICNKTCDKLALLSKNGKDLHLFLREKSEKDILRQLGIDRLTPCPKCGLLKPSCDCILNGEVPKELKQLMKAAMLTSEGQCYEAQKNCIPLPKESSFQCYCASHGDGTGCPSKIINSKPNGLLINGDHNHTDAQQSIGDSLFIGTVDKFCAHDHVGRGQNSDLMHRKSHLPSDILERLQNSETDSCLSMESGSFSGSLQKSMEGTNMVEENISSCGRCGSADSGICRISPLSSPSTKSSANFTNSIDEVLEEDFRPIQLPMPRVLEERKERKGSELSSDEDGYQDFNNFGRSLFVGIGDSYRADFVLQGVPTNTHLSSVTSDLKLSLQHSVLDDPISEAVCIVADTDAWECKLVSVKKVKKQSSNDLDPVQPVELSNLVLSMLNSVTGLCEVGMPAEFCLMHLEDKLKEIYLKSKVISECLKDRSRMLTKNDLSQMLGIDDSDISLLLAVASTHSPQSMTFVRT